jgi:hypothetical protein
MEQNWIMVGISPTVDLNNVFPKFQCLAAAASKAHWGIHDEKFMTRRIDR